MKLVDLTDTVVEYLRGTIPNPHTTGNWIYSDYPRVDATFPRISLTQAGGALTEIGIGECTEAGKHGHLASVDFDIDIWVKVEDRATISGTIYVGTKLREKYTDLIVDALERNKEDFKDDGILDVEILSINSVPLDEDNMLHRKTISVKFTFIWEYD